MEPDVGFLRRVTPALLVALAGGALLYALPSPEGTDESPVATPTTAPTGGPTAGPTSSATTGDATQAAPRTVHGDAIQFRYGVVQTDVELTGTTITDIVTLQAPGGRYQPYTDRAVPEMRQRILTAQSTDVSSVSGATYTSVGYAQSVQSALDRA